MNNSTPTTSSNTAGPASARDLFERYKREEERRAKGLPPEDADPTACHLKGEQLERPDNLVGPTPAAVEFLRHPERWPRQLPDGRALVPILRRRYMPGSRFNDLAVLSSDDPNLSRAIEAGWEAD